MLLYRNQTGTVLVSSLVFLIILTLVSVAAMNKTIVQAKMATNFQNTDMAFQASESGLASGEDIISALIKIPETVTNCSNDCEVVFWAKNALQARFGSGNHAWWSPYKIDKSEEFWEARGRKLPQTDVVSYVSEQPRFVIEEYGYLPDDLSPGTRASGVGTYFYRVTSRGVGGLAEINEKSSPNQSIVQSIYAKRFN